MSQLSAKAQKQEMEYVRKLQKEAESKSHLPSDNYTNESWYYLELRAKLGDEKAIDEMNKRRK